MKKIETPARPAPTTALRTVLYVEDDDENWLVALLRMEKRCHLVRARGAAEAAQLLRSPPADLQAILMDIQLMGSDLNGIELTQLLRGNLALDGRPDYLRGVPRSNAPIFFVTAYGTRYTAAEIKAFGGNGLLHKPVDFVQLCSRLTESSLDSMKTTLGRW